MRYAVIETATNIVSNVVILSDASEWVQPDSFAIRSDEANIGDTYDGQTFIAPPPPLPEEEPPIE